MPRLGSSKRQILCKAWQKYFSSHKTAKVRMPRYMGGVKFKKSLQRVEKIVTLGWPCLPSRNILNWKISSFLLLCRCFLCLLYYSHTFLSTLLIIKRAEEFPHTKQFSVTPAGCPTIKPLLTVSV